MSGRNLIGLAETDITPNYTTVLDGYSCLYRDSEGVHDRLCARCLLLESENVIVAILSVPTVSVEAESTDIIRTKASKLTGIPKLNILVHATHTHSCPVIQGDYKELLENKCAVCVRDAYDKRFPGKIGFGSTTVSECGKNRRYLDYGGLPVDPETGIIKVEDDQGRLKAIVYNYACHCTVLGADNKLITEDWPFFTNKKIKDLTGNNTIGIFLQGASGDINPGYSAGLSAVGAKIPTRTWDEAQRIGERVGEAIGKALDAIVTESKFRLKSSNCYVDLPLRDTYPVTLREAEEKIKTEEQKVAKLERSKEPVSVKQLERAKMELFFASLIKRGADNFYGGKWGKTASAELQTIVVGDNIITTFPGEVFFEAGVAVKASSPAKHTLIAGLSNAHEARGYMPTGEACLEGDYEVYETHYGPAAADILVKASVKHNKEIF